MVKKYIGYLPRIGAALIIALASKLIADSLPVHIISASVVALFIGMIINSIAGCSI